MAGKVYRKLGKKQKKFSYHNVGKCKSLLIAFFGLLLLASCTLDSEKNNTAQLQATKSPLFGTTAGTNQAKNEALSSIGNETPSDITKKMPSGITDEVPSDIANDRPSAVTFENIINIPSQTARDFSEAQVFKPDYQMVEEIFRNTAIYDVRYRAPYLIYSHASGYNDAISIYDVNSRARCEFPSRTSLRRFIRFVSFNDLGYEYMTTAEHEPYSWLYFQFDSLDDNVGTTAFDMRKVVGKENAGTHVSGSDVEEEGNLFAWVDGTLEDGVPERLLHICLMNEDTPELIHTIQLNRGVNTLTPLTIKNQCVSYIDWNPETEKWYICTYDIFKGENSPDSCNFELETQPGSPPLFDRSALAWVEQKEGEQLLYSYNLQDKEKYLIDTGITNPSLEYPSLFYVKDGKLFCFDFRENRKHILYESENEQVVYGGGNTLLPYCLTEDEKGSTLRLLHTMPPSMKDIPQMKWIKNNQGVLELERENPFIRTGMDNCTVIYNGLERPGLFVHDMGWPIEGVCSVIRAEIVIGKTKNVLGADVPEKFTVSHGNVCLTFTGEAVPNVFGDGGASYKCCEFPSLEALYIKRNIVIDLPDLLDALQIPWTAEPAGNVFVIEDGLPYTNTKPVLEINDKDLNHDSTKDTVGLYLAENLDVILQINDDNVSVFNISHEGQVFGDTPSDRYQCNIYIEGNEILVGVTYSFTNKYGSTSWLYSYSYESDKIEKIWSSEEIFQKKVLIESYNEENNIIEVKVGTDIKEIRLDDAEEEEFINFTSYLKNIGSEKMEMEFIITPDYEYKDYNGDGCKEIITRTIVHFGASSLIRSFYSVYDFSSEGVQLIDGFFR